MISLHVELHEHVESTIAKEILSKNIIHTLIETDELTLYNGGVFHRGKQAYSEVRDLITQLSEQTEYVWTDDKGEVNSKPYKLTISKRQEIIEQLKTRSFISLRGFDNNPTLINVRNGIILIDEHKKIISNPLTEDGHYESQQELITENVFGPRFIPHSEFGWDTDPTTFIDGIPPFKDPPKCFIQIPVDYDPNAECLEIDQFLEEIFGFDRVPLIYEMMGYMIMTTIKYGKAFILYGPTGTGKTSFINLLQQFIGGEHPERIISHVRLQDLSKRFQAANLRNKLLNIFDDLKETKLFTSDYFKIIVTNRLLSGEIKNVQGDVTWHNFCKQLYACNELPGVPKKTGNDFWKRWMLIQCFNEFKGQKCDLDVRAKKWSDEQLSGLLNKCIQAWIRLETRKHFPKEYDDIEKVKGTWLIDVNPVKLFVDECCEYYNENYVFGYKSFKRAVNTFRKEHNAQPITQTMCTQSLGKIDDRIEKSEWGAHKRKEFGERYYYLGIKLKKNVPLDIDQILSGNRNEPKSKKMDKYIDETDIS